MAAQASSSPPPDATNRRRSGRVVTKPAFYQEDADVSVNTNGSSKRKRVKYGGHEADSDNSQDSDLDSDQEQPKKTKGNAKARKPANKKPKTAPGITKLAMRPAVNGARRPSKAKKAQAGASVADENDLYAHVFLSRTSTAEVAQKWLEGYNQDNASGVCSLVNFVLKCTGCDLKVDNHDIEDPDNAPNKLTDLQEEYQSQKITDYPLIQRVKGNDFSRRELENFFHDLVNVLHESGTIYEDEPLYPNIETWVVPMTSSPIRPFRHTATVIALALTSAFCEVMKNLDHDLGLTTRQKQQEEKGKRKAKDKIASYEAKISRIEERKQEVSKWIQELFDSVFVHRYRDIDPKIRSDCIVALGHWIETCPDIFYEGTYLRYLGWLMSDQNNAVRHQVIVQLQRIYDKDSPDVGRLRAFTQRFRDRMVEIATRDSESNIRALTIDLLDSVKDVGLLETEHIDTVGRLIFDTDPKVRKAVAPFFASNVEDAFNNITEALGGEEGLEDVLGQETEHDYDSPSPTWLRYKSIAQLIDEYDAEDDELEEVQEARILSNLDAASSRYITAATVVYDGIQDVHDKWQGLAGYLLYDATAKQSAKKRKSQDPLELFKQRCNLTEKQERLLLEVLLVAAKLSQEDAIDAHQDKKAKKNRARLAEDQVKAEQNTRYLINLLPRLLRKFGANPTTAAIVLRMAQSVSFDDLSEESAEYEALLDDIGKQFLSHADRNVIEAASSALFCASRFDDLEEVTLGKINDLWEKVSASLRQNVRTKNVQLEAAANNVLKIQNLTEISDPAEVFTRTAGHSKSKDQAGSLLELLLGLIDMYSQTEDADAEAVVIRSATAISKFYMWSVKSLRSTVAASGTVDSARIVHKERFSASLISFIQERHKTDASRLAAISVLLDVHTAFAILRQGQTSDDHGSATASAAIISEVPTEGVDLIRSSLIKLEQQFAKKAGKSLETVVEDDVEDAPESDDDEDDDAEDLDATEQTQRVQQRQQERLLLERSLCELAGKIVLAILARVMDTSGPEKGKLQQILTRNKNKLGANFKEVVSYLEEPVSKKVPKSKPKSAAVVATAAKPTQVSAPEEAEEEEEDEIEEVEDGDEEDLRRRELLTDPPEDDDIEDEDGDANEGGAGHDDDEDDIMGD